MPSFSETIKEQAPAESSKPESSSLESSNPDKLVDISPEQQISAGQEQSSAEVLVDSIPTSETGTSHPELQEHHVDSTDAISADHPYVDVASKRVYTDDNGTIYRVDDSLRPNMEYAINGYLYRTDSQGRITGAEGELHLRKRDGRKVIRDDMETIGKGSQRKTDDRGHLIGDIFDGGNGLENIVPMDKKLNQSGGYWKLEKTLGDALAAGCKVYYKVEPRYSGNSHRPSEFVVTYTIDGETTVTVFKNEGASRDA